MYHTTGRQLAAARILVGWSQERVSAAANVSIATLRRIESAIGVPSAMPNNVDAVQRVLEAAGIEFTHEMGKIGITLRGRPSDA